MLDLKQRNVIRGYLDAGMSPDAIANHLGRLADLEESDLVMIRLVAGELLNASSQRATTVCGRPQLGLIRKPANRPCPAR